MTHEVVCNELKCDAWGIRSTDEYGDPRSEKATGDLTIEPCVICGLTFCGAHLWRGMCLGCEATPAGVHSMFDSAAISLARSGTPERPVTYEEYNGVLCLAHDICVSIELAHPGQV